MRSIYCRFYAKLRGQRVRLWPGITEYASSRRLVNALARPPGHGTDPFGNRSTKGEKSGLQKPSAYYPLLIHTNSLVITHSACAAARWPSDLIQAKTAVSSTLSNTKSLSLDQHAQKARGARTAALRTRAHNNHSSPKNTAQQKKKR